METRGHGHQHRLDRLPAGFEVVQPGGGQFVPGELQSSSSISPRTGCRDGLLRRVGSVGDRLLLVEEPEICSEIRWPMSPSERMSKCIMSPYQAPRWSFSPRMASSRSCRNPLRRITSTSDRSDYLVSCLSFFFGGRPSLI